MEQANNPQPTSQDRAQTTSTRFKGIISLKFLRRGGRFASAGFISLIVLSVFSTAALASIPSSNGVITACYPSQGRDDDSQDKGKGDDKEDRRGDYRSGGFLRVIDPATNKCTKNETQLTWNQTGPKGDKGDTGATGAQGPKGDTGAVGPQGPAGKDGAPGKDGAVGPQGPKGDKGDTGAQGPQGLKGDTGATGAQGPKGDKGDTGPAGLSGLEISHQYSGDLSSNKSYTVDFTCPNNKRVIAAGYVVFNRIKYDTFKGLMGTSIRESRPLSDSVWRISLDTYQESDSLEIYLTCINK